MILYQPDDPAEQTQRAAALIAALGSCPIPELPRLGRTLHGGVTNSSPRSPTPMSATALENLNPKIKNTKRVARGYRNFTNYPLRLLLHQGRIQRDHSPTRIRTRRLSLGWGRYTGMSSYSITPAT